eukprot:scaffold29149_cov65-Phaeocystis_antarctica.AAC.4
MSCSDLRKEEALELVRLAAGVLVRRRGHGLLGLLEAVRVAERHHVIEVVAARAKDGRVRAVRTCEGVRGRRRTRCSAPPASPLLGRRRAPHS